VAPGLEPYAAVRYEPDGRRVTNYDFDHKGGSAVLRSAHDLVRFGMFHLKNHLPDQKRILADSTIDAMHSEHHRSTRLGLRHRVGGGRRQWLLRYNHTAACRA
jgi:hypothetical protein